MTDNSAFGEIFADAPLMAILRGMGAERRLAVATRAWGLGITAVEEPVQTKDAGAAFTVSPGFDVEVVRGSHEAGLPALPGVATATEAQRALGEGLTWLKAFPAAVLGTGWFPAMHGPFPQAQFVATGGMDSSNARAFLDAGARVVAVGSALEDEAQLPALAALFD